MLHRLHFSTIATSMHLFNKTAPAYARPMSKPDRFKEEISWLKAFGSVLLASGISLCVWLVQNYATLSHSALLASICGLFVFATGIVAIIVRLYRCFKILEAL
ncbi:MAG: hypothetical protein WDO68_21545 [Gammaproteobacteria bacterium]